MNTTIITKGYFEENTFTQVPDAVIFNEKLTPCDKMLYALLMKRYMSATYVASESFTDNNGNTYITYKREELCKLMSVSEPTIRKSFKSLTSAGLIKEEKDGSKGANHIYVYAPCKASADVPTAPKTEKKSMKSIFKKKNNEVKGETIEKIKAQIDYNGLLEDDYVAPHMDSVMAAFKAVFFSHKKAFTISGKEINIETLRTAFKSLTSGHIHDICRRFERACNKVSYGVSYLITCLYNAAQNAAQKLSDGNSKPSYDLDNIEKLYVGYQENNKQSYDIDSFDSLAVNIVGNRTNNKPSFDLDHIENFYI